MKITKDPIEFDATDFYAGLAIISGSWGHWWASMLFVAILLWLVYSREKHWDTEHECAKEDKKDENIHM